MQAGFGQDKAGIRQDFMLSRVTSGRIKSFKILKQNVTEMYTSSVYTAGLWQCKYCKKLTKQPNMCIAN